MARRPTTASAARTRVGKNPLPSFEEYFRTTLGVLLASIKNRDYRVACGVLSELTENLDHIGLHHLAIDLIGELEDHAEKMRAADSRGWAWCLSSKGTALSRAGRLEEALDSLAEMLALGQSLGDEDVESTALQSMGVIRFRMGQRDEARRLYAIALETKTRLGDERGQAQIQNNLASMAIEDGDLDQAQSLLDSSMAIKRRFRDREGLVAAYGTLGNLAVARGDYRAGRKHFRRSLELAHAVGDPEDVALSHLNLGNVNLELGRGDDALSLYEAGLEVARANGLREADRMLLKALAVGCSRLSLFPAAMARFLDLAGSERLLGDAFGEGMAYHDAAVVAVQSGNPEDALTYYDRAVRGFRNANRPEWRARSLWEKASVLARTGRPAESLSAVNRSIRVLQHYGLRDALVGAYAAGVQILFSAGLVERAASLFKRELLFLQAPAGAAYRARRLTEVASLLLDCGRPARAILLLQQAVSLYQEVGNPTLEGLARNDLARARAERGQLDRARREYDALVEQATRNDDRALRLLALTNLAEVARRQGNPDTAVELGAQGIDLAVQLNDTDSLPLLLNNLGLAYEELGNAAEARRCFRKSIGSARREADSAAAARALSSLGSMEASRGHYERALAFYDRALGLAGRDDAGLMLDLLENRLMCLIASERDQDASETASQAIELAERSGNYGRAEGIARTWAVANLEGGDVESSAEALVAGLLYASKQRGSGIMENIAVWAVLLAEADGRPYARDALRGAIAGALRRAVPEAAASILDILDLAERECVGASGASSLDDHPPRCP